MINLLIGIAAGFIGGGALAYVIWNMALTKKKNGILAEAQSEGEVIKKDKILQAKEKFLQLKSDHEKYIQEKNTEINGIENRAKQKDAAVNQRRDELQRKIKEFETSKREVEIIRENLNTQMQRLEHKSEESWIKCIARTWKSWNKFPEFLLKKLKRSW